MSARTRILIINPITETRFEAWTRRELEEICPEDVHLDVVSIDEGPSAIESRADERRAVGGVIARATEWQDRCDAIVINCFGDPGLRETQQVIRVPVVGPGAASFHLASQLGDRISVVTVDDGVVDMLRDIAVRAGAAVKLVGVRSARVHVAELDDPESMHRVVEMCVTAAHEDDADVVILGCTGMAALAPAVRASFRRAALKAKLVVPAGAALFTAYALARTVPLEGRPTSAAAQAGRLDASPTDEGIS